MDDPTKFASMSQYQVFQCAVGLLLFSEFMIWILTSGRKGKDREKSRNQRDGGTVWLVIGGFCLSFYVSYWFRSQEFVRVFREILFPEVFYYVGIGLIFSGIVVRTASVWTLKRNFTLSVQTSSSQHLVKSGMYRSVRNPAYTGSILSLLGVAIALRSVCAPFAVLVICMACYSIRIHVEEEALKERFGREFEEYADHTWRLIPYIY